MQLREKDAETREFLEHAQALKTLLSPKKIPLIINDRVDIALAVDAEGVKLADWIRRTGGDPLIDVALVKFYLAAGRKDHEVIDRAKQAARVVEDDAIVEFANDRRAR